MDAVQGMPVSGGGGGSETSADLLKSLCSSWESVAAAEESRTLASSCSMISSSVLAAAPPLKEQYMQTLTQLDVNSGGDFSNIVSHNKMLTRLMDLTFLSRMRKCIAKEISKLFKAKCRFSLFSASDLHICWEAAGRCGDSRGSLISVFEKLGTKEGRKWLCVCISGKRCKRVSGCTFVITSMNKATLIFNHSSKKIKYVKKYIKCFCGYS